MVQKPLADDASSCHRAQLLMVCLCVGQKTAAGLVPAGFVYGQPALQAKLAAIFLVNAVLGTDGKI